MSYDPNKLCDHCASRKAVITDTFAKMELCDRCSNILPLSERRSLRDNPELLRQRMRDYPLEIHAKARVELRQFFKRLAILLSIPVLVIAIFIWPYLGLIICSFLIGGWLVKTGESFFKTVDRIDKNLQKIANENTTQ